jgi:hypothetical protein
LARNVGIDISAVSASGKVEENHDVQSRIHSSNVISSMSELVDIEIPRENLPPESQRTVLLSSNGVLATTPKNRNRECAKNYEDEGEKWIEVIRKSRGKHPRKRLQC